MGVEHQASTDRGLALLAPGRWAWLLDRPQCHDDEVNGLFQIRANVKRLFRVFRARLTITTVAPAARGSGL